MILSFFDFQPLYHIITKIKTQAQLLKMQFFCAVRTTVKEKFTNLATEIRAFSLKSGVIGQYVILSQNALTKDSIIVYNL